MSFDKYAALIRGLCTGLTGKPESVIYEALGAAPIIAAPIPAEVMLLEIKSGETEENAALVIKRAYDNWKKSASITNSAGENTVPLPSCAALCANGKPEALFWIGESFDSAQKKLLEKNAAPWTESAAKPEALVGAKERSCVVKNRIALVTGGAQGIGEEIVRNLAGSGAMVFIADMNLEKAGKLAEELNRAEGRTAAFAASVNVADEASVEKLFSDIAKKCGGLDLCVSNAGVLKAGSVLEQELADFKFVTDVNYTGFFLVAKYAARLMRTQHLTSPLWKTDIVQINSKSGLEGSDKNGAYSGGKFGSLGLVASFAKELVEYNIKVNAICPGNFLDGPLWSHPENGLFVQYLKAGKVPGAKTVADVRLFYEAKVPMKRGCTGKDLVRALYYIVEQEYETGQAVPVTGGQVMLH